MNYTFFDIECANCFNGLGKICSFGYCIVDESFNIVETKDIIINPKSRFFLGPIKSEDVIQLAYEKNVFKKAPDFNYYYETIKELLTKEDNLLFGHSVANDLSFLLAEFHRYNRKVVEFKAYDTQALYKQITKGKNDIGLDKLCGIYNIDVENLHRSDCDSIMTMKAFKAMCEDQKMSPIQLLEMYPNVYATLASDGTISKKFEPITNSKKLLNYCLELCAAHRKNSNDNRFAFDEDIENDDFPTAKEYVKKIVESGSKFVSKVGKCNYYVYRNLDSEKSKKVLTRNKEKEKKITVINEQQLLEMLNKR